MAILCLELSEEGTVRLVLLLDSDNVTLSSYLALLLSLVLLEGIDELTLQSRDYYWLFIIKFLLGVIFLGIDSLVAY